MVINLFNSFDVDASLSTIFASDTNRSLVLISFNFENDHLHSTWEWPKSAGNDILCITQSTLCYSGCIDEELCMQSKTRLAGFAVFFAR